MVPCRTLKKLRATPNDLPPIITNYYLLVCFIKMVPVHAFMLPDDDPAIVNMMVSGEAKHHAESGSMAEAARVGGTTFVESPAKAFALPAA